MDGRMEFEWGLGSSRGTGAQKLPSRALRVLVLADLSGRDGRGEAAGGDLAERRPIELDVDSFDSVLEKISPRIALPLGQDDAALEIEFRELCDFHPDALFDRLDLFRKLRQSRKRLLDPATFDEAAAQMRPAESQEEANEESEDESATLERLLGRKSAAGTGDSPVRAASRFNLDRFIGGIVADQLAPHVDPRQHQFVATVDQVIGEQMRAVLHHPAFQRIEATWRSVQGLISNIETGDGLSVHLLDVSKSELAADVALAGSDMTNSGIYRLLVDQGGATGAGWSLLIGDYSFGSSGREIGLLAALGAVASEAGGPFVAAADGSFLGVESIADRPDPTDWPALDEAAAQRVAQLRAFALAPWIGLALPRMLLRLPYGAKSDSVERFEFEEAEGGLAHEHYLWGNAAFGCARLMARAFAEGDDVGSPSELEIDDLPWHSYDDRGEPAMKACAEVFLGHRAADALMDRGLMPWLSFKDRNAVRVGRLQSVAQPAAALRISSR